MRAHAAEGQHMIGWDGVANNYYMQYPSSGTSTPALYHTPASEQIDFNTNAVCGGFQPRCFEELNGDYLTLQVGGHTKAPMESGLSQGNPSNGQNISRSSTNPPLSKADKISGFKHNIRYPPNFSTFTDYPFGERCRSSYTLHPSSVFQPPTLSGEYYFPLPNHGDHFNPAVGRNSGADFSNLGDHVGSLQIAAPSTTASGNSQIGLSDHSRSCLTYFSFAPSLLLREHTQRASEQQRESYRNARNYPSECSTFSSSLGASGTISVPDQSVEPNPSAPRFAYPPVSANMHVSLQAQIEQVPSVTASPQTFSHVPIQPQVSTKIAPNSQNREQTTQPTISESVPSAPSSCKDVRVRPPLRSRTSPYYIKCRDLHQTSELSGQKCFLCKRDLLFNPEGPVFLPKIIPPVAVLPCGHMFHDLCLERITPEGQTKDPSCISCAIGDS